MPEPGFVLLGQGKAILLDDDGSLIGIMHARQCAGTIGFRQQSECAVAPDLDHVCRFVSIFENRNLIMVENRVCRQAEICQSDQPGNQGWGWEEKNCSMAAPMETTRSCRY